MFTLWMQTKKILSKIRESFSFVLGEIMKRTEKRELAFQIIYSKFFNPTEQDYLDEANQDELDFTQKILNEFATHYNDINELINKHLKGYTFDRLFKVDLSIIILAIIELKYLNENPIEVVINEALEIAKKYSTENSPKFIHGFLATLIKSDETLSKMIDSTKLKYTEPKGRLITKEDNNKVISDKISKEIETKNNSTISTQIKEKTVNKSDTSVKLNKK